MPSRRMEDDVDAPAELETLTDPLEPETSLAGRVIRSRGFLAFLAVVAGGVLLVQGIDALGGAEGIRERFGTSAMWFLVPAQIVVSASPVPGELVAAVSIGVYGFWLGAFLCWLGWVGGSFLEYGLVRFMVRDLDADPKTLERLPGFLKRLPADHPAFLIFGRYVPYGAHAVNIAAAMKGVPFGRFAWTALLAIGPSSLLFAALVSGLVSLGG